MNAQSKTLLFSMFAISSLSAMEELSSSKLTKIKASSIFSTNEVGKVDLFHNDEGFYVMQNDEICQVNKYSVDPLLRSLKHKQLKKFQKCGYIHVKKNQDNEFSLVSKVRGNGGGLYTGWILYSATKALAYTGLATITLPLVIVPVPTVPLVAAGGAVAAGATVAGTGALITAGIETVSVAAFAAGTACWFLP